MDHEIRRGAVTGGGKGEIVLGLGFMLMGENSHVVTRALKSKRTAKSRFRRCAAVGAISHRTTCGSTSDSAKRRESIAFGFAGRTAIRRISADSTPIAM